MNPARLLAASVVFGLWTFSARAADLRPTNGLTKFLEARTPNEAEIVAGRPRQTS
jgi:hypothetical protein